MKVNTNLVSIVFDSNGGMVIGSWVVCSFVNMVVLDFLFIVFGF